MAGPQVKAQPVQAGAAGTAVARMAARRPALARGRATQGRNVEALLSSQAKEAAKQRADTGARLLEQLKVKRPEVAAPGAATSALNNIAAQTSLVTSMALLQQAAQAAQNQPLATGALAGSTQMGSGVDLSTFKKDVPDWYQPKLATWKGVTLNVQALSALQAASRRIGTAITGGGFRSHSQQIQTYQNKPGLAAPPGYSYHELGLAIDVNIGRLQQLGVWGAAQKALRAAGFKQLDGEPWHWSFRVYG